MARINGRRHRVGRLYSDNVSCILITIMTAADAAVDLRAEDDTYDEAVEAIVMEINTLGFFVTDSAAGTIMMVADVSHSATGLQGLIRNLGTTVGTNNIDVSGSTVVDVAYSTNESATSGSFVVGGVYTITSLGDNSQANWNTAAGTSGVVYVVGDEFIAAAVGTAGTGTATYWTDTGTIAFTSP